MFNATKRLFGRRHGTINRTRSNATVRVANSGDTSFTATLYVDGAIASHCRVWIEDRPSGRAIHFERADPSGGPAAGETLEVAEHDGTLYMQLFSGPLSGPAYHPGALLTKVETTAYLWQCFDVPAP